MKRGAARAVTAPDGARWRVGRMWFGERQIRSFAWRDKLGSVLGDSDVGFLDVFDGLDLESGLVLLALVAAVALVVLPLVFFGVELIILGCLLAVGVLGRSLFGKPWTVAATRGREEVPAALWRVKGWRASGELISQICVDLEARGQLASEFPQAAYVERVDDSATRL